MGISVPQISSVTGVSGDYWNEFYGHLCALDMEEAGEECSLLLQISENPIKKYTERFDSKIYDNVLIQRNRAAIESLDLIVERLNSLADSKINFQEFRENCILARE